MRAVLSIGSNIGDRRAWLRGVVEAFESAPRSSIVAVSPLYETPAWGVTDQADFLNAVLIVEVEDTPMELLRRGQALEEAAQRTRLRHWGPRTLDVDIVALYEGPREIRCDSEELRVPHPFARERAFVLVPWLAADPAATLGGEPVADLVDRLDPADVAAIRPGGEW